MENKKTKAKKHYQTNNEKKLQQRPQEYYKNLSENGKIEKSQLC